MGVLHTPSRHTFECDGTQRVFPIPSLMISQDFVRIEIDGVLQSDRKQWDIVNNSLVFVLAPINGAILDVQVASDSESLGELGMIVNVDILAQNITNVNKVANIDTNVTTVANNTANVNKVANNTANINTVANNTANVNKVVNNTANINTVANNILDIQNAQENAIIAKEEASKALGYRNEALSSATLASIYKDTTYLYLEDAQEVQLEISTRRHEGEYISMDLSNEDFGDVLLSSPFSIENNTVNTDLAVSFGTLDCGTTI